MLPACDTLPSGPRDPWPRPPPLAVQTRHGEGSDPPRARRACVSDEVAAQIILEASDAAMEEVFTKERLREEWRCASIVYGGRPGRHTPRGARLSQQHFWFNVCDFIRLSMSLLVQRALISTCARQEQAARNLHEAKCNEIAGNEEECAHFALLPGGLHVPLG